MPPANFQREGGEVNVRLVTSAVRASASTGRSERLAHAYKRRMLGIQYGGGRFEKVAYESKVAREASDRMKHKFIHMHVAHALCVIQCVLM